MNERGFNLLLFPPPKTPAIQQATLDVAIYGSLTLDSQHIIINFKLKGNNSLVKHPPIASTPQRKDNLWQTTCFEVFTATTASSEYWEYNISPCHNWNVYSFNDYRSKQALAPPFTGMVKIKTLYSNSHLDGITASLPLPQPLVGREIILGINSVLQDINNNLHYYALIHPNLKPDFHDRRGFIMCLNH
ncbi:MAG: hypothetical protein GXP08_17595 [Gammaproteobacteria bacterium]|nr:hypothetical protein [Gammaproteobacteria bacterium]